MPSNVMSIRRRPRWQILSALKRAGITQAEIGRRVGLGQSAVSLVLARKIRGGKASLVWAEIERVVERRT
jgi:DNA transposition AAA+ family ATPase